MDLSLSLPSQQPTAQIGQLFPVRLSYTEFKELNIPESWIPNIFSAICIEDYPNLQLENITEFEYYKYGSNYFRIYGDTTLIYQGFEPPSVFFYQDNINNGNILLSLTSKWFTSTLSIQVGADIYTIDDGIIDNIITWDNITMGVNGWADWREMIIPAIDSLSSSSITGTGKRYVSTMIDDGGGSYHQDIVETKNITTISSLFSSGFKTGVTKFVFNSGFLYKNGVYQNQVTNYSVAVKGTLWDEPTFRSSDKNGDLIADSLIYFLTSRLFSGDSTNYAYRLWWDTIRARDFSIGTSNFNINPPVKSDYQSNTLPYTDIFVKVNPDNYPLIEKSGTIDYALSADSENWSKKSDGIYNYHKKGSILFYIPATINIGDTVDFCNETWSAGITTYTKDATNRTPKDVVSYIPDIIGIKAKLFLMAQNAIQTNQIKAF